MSFEEKLEIGTEVCFFKGKKDKSVAYTDNGRVILCRHKISLGYAKIKSVEDRGNYFLITAEHIVKDVYAGIDYNDFIKVLPLHGFNVGFDRIFTHKYADGGNAQEHQIYAYNLKNNVIIIAETFTWKGDTRKGFNSINVYCPQVSVFKFNRCVYVSRGNTKMTVFDLVRGDRGIDLLKWINSVMEGVENPVWPKYERPVLWTYEDTLALHPQSNCPLGRRYILRLLDASESLEIFKGCEFLKELERVQKICKHKDRNCLTCYSYYVCYEQYTV